MKKPLRVLMVEDSENDALLLMEELRTGGFEPSFVRVEKSDTFIANLDQGDWDIILVDYSMPYFSGLEALRLLKERDLDVPLILVSGTVGEEVAVEAMKAGAQDYIMKDNLIRLVPAIQRELQDSRYRREAESNLRESEVRFRSVFENAADGILIVDVENKRFADANNKFCQMLGYVKEELLNMEVDNLHPENKLPMIRDQFEMQARGEIITAREIPVLRKDGSVFYADIASFPIVISGKSYLTGFFRDVTENKQIKDELKKHRLHLEDIVRERTERLNKMVTFMAGREVRMSELKKIIRKLRDQLTEAGIEPAPDDNLLKEWDLSTD